MIQRGPQMSVAIPQLDTSNGEKQTRNGVPVSPVSKQPPGQLTLPLSFPQQQLWIHAQLASDVALYREVLILERRGSLNRAALERSLQDIIQRHAALRTSFTVVDGSPAQVIAENGRVGLPLLERNGGADEQRKSDVLKIATEQARKTLALEEGPALRARLLRFPQENWVLIVTLHTLVADAWSLNIFARELSMLYEAYAADQPSPLTDLPIQYSDYMYWQRDFFEEALERDLPYWWQRLAGIPPVLELPTDRPHPPVQQFRGASLNLSISQELSDSIKHLGERESVTPFVTLIAAFQTLLSRYTGQDDIVIGSLIPGREAWNEALIGLLAHTMVIRTDMTGDPTFRDLMGRVSEATRRDCEHPYAPFERIVSGLQITRDPSRNPLFQVLFSLVPSISLPESGWQTAGLEIDEGTAKVDLELQLIEGPEGITGRFTYNTDLFDASTIARMAGHFQVLLQGIARNPDERLSKLPILTDSERHQLLVEWNDTRSQYPSDQCVHELFERQVVRRRNAPAVVFEDQALTYAELNRRSNQLAHYLRKLGIGPDALVGLCVERSLEMIVGLLGILKAGGAYVPLDPAYPPERLSFMLEDSEVEVLLTQNRLVASLPKVGGRVVCLDSGWQEIAEESIENPETLASPKNLAYVIYTSGSTGKPKGVQISHRAVVNFLTSMSQKPGLTDRDRLLAVTTLCFDIAGLEIYLPLSMGARLEIASREVASDGSQLLSKLISSGATVLQATPASWRMLLEAGWEGSPQLKSLCGGEAVSRKLANQLVQKTGSLWNMYGPTETTIWSTTARIEMEDAPIPIGKPIANTQIYILDKLQQPVPIGIAGELHIGGDGLARGYLKRPELTAEKFIADPFSAEPEARLYKTGDLVRYLPNGHIEFIGRIDHQIKIRGFRIELGEIEAVLRQHGSVNDTVVMVREDTPGDQRLVAYLVPTQESAAPADELRGFLKEKLPDYMVPSVFVVLSAMPLTPNGKVNRGALPAPGRADFAAKESFVAPRNPVESQLVKIWESVLGVRPIGVANNFFDLGGYSLLAVRLMQRIEDDLHKKIPIATLFQAPTIEKLAGVIGHEGWSPAWSSLVPIQTGGSKPPFFCVHGAAATVIRLYHLARHLGPDQPFYGIQARGLNGTFPCHTRVEDMAAHYIKEIRDVCPHGPYFLGGYSFGGMVALEMAQQLMSQGEGQSVVILFDTFCPTPASSPSLLKDTASVSKRILSAPLNLLRMGPSKSARYVLKLAAVLVTGVQRRVHTLTLPAHLKRVRAACEQAGKEYVPRPYPGRIVLFRSSMLPLTQFRDPHAPWFTYATNGLEIREIEGSHDGILLEPGVRLVAQKLTLCLSEEARRPVHQS